MLHPPRCAAPMLVFVVACGTTTRDPDVFGDGSEASITPTSDGGGSATTPPVDADDSASAEGDADTTHGGIKLDVGALTMAGDGGDADGCDKVDFLFVIDNSGSMADEQADLIASFGHFIDAIQNTIAAQDYHIMVVSTDDGTGGGSSITCINGECSCTPVPACCQQICNGFGDNCNGFPCDELPGGACETTLGAGKIFEEDGTSCLPGDGPRYMTEAQPDLADTFSCAAHVGTYGSGDERPMAAMLAATSAALNQDGGCDAGFLRDDAVLVVTFITDEEDVMKSPGDPQSWHDDLIANKGGNATAVAVLGLIGDGDLPNGVCAPLQDDVGAEPSPRLREFVTSFADHGVAGSICADDYIPFFLEAASLVDTTCDSFDPQG